MCLRCWPHTVWGPKTLRATCCQVVLIFSWKLDLIAGEVATRVGYGDFQGRQEVRDFLMPFVFVLNQQTQRVLSFPTVFLMEARIEKGRNIIIIIYFLLLFFLIYH